MAMPKFVSSGAKVKSSSAYISWEAGETKQIVMLTGLEHPEDEEQTGKNCIVHFDQYSIWIDDLPDGVKSPMFPKLPEANEPGKVLGLEARFRAMALVMETDTEEEKVWGMTKTVFDQLEPIEDATGKSLRGALLSVTRKGKKLDTRYTVTFTGKTYDLDGEPEIDLIDYVGPTNREDIVKMLEAVDMWPPAGGDPADE